MKKIGLFSVFSLLGLTTFAQADIAAARNMAIGQTVTIKGVVTNGSELGTIRYVQDATGALPAFGNILNSVLRGDSISVTGVLYDYNGLLEISPTNSFQDLGNGTLPTPNQIPITSVSEALEAQLLQFDNVTFVETGSFVGNTNYNITDGTNTLQVRISTGSNLVGQAIPTGAISIRGLLGQFNSFQLLPRDQNDIFAYVAPQREINVKVTGTTYLNNSQYVIGTNNLTTFTIENLGVGNLTVSGVAFSGANAAEFSTTFTNQVIGGGQTANVTVQFTPAGNGSRLATMTINSDDADEAAYAIDFYGIGNDGVATQPSANPTNLTFSNVQAYTYSGSFTGSGAENYIVVWKDGSAVTGVPVDGTTYKRGDVVGTGKVAYVGPATNFTPRHIIANQNQYFSVFAFNGPAGYENYRTAAPLTGNVTSGGANIGTYYSTISTASPTFIADLTALINPHTVISYGNYKPTVMNQFEVRDTTLGRSFVICSYTGERKVFNDPFDWTATGYSREHTYSHSWMPTFPADNPAKPEYSDQHNLYPVNQNQANAVRSNLPMNVVTGNVQFSYLGGKVGYNGSQLVYEPRDEQKGNAARAMFYMAAAYNGVSGNNWGFGTNQPEAVMKEWHFADLPDNYEIARNEYIFSIQGNRNPFVDSVNYACFINFTDMSKINSGCGLSTEEMMMASLSVFPVPASNDLFAQINGQTISEYVIYDMNGRVIAQASNVSLPVLHLQTAGWNSGVYQIKLSTEMGTVTQKFIKE